jgi:hypothetical protein
MRRSRVAKLHEFEAFVLHASYMLLFHEDRAVKIEHSYDWIEVRNEVSATRFTYR